MLVCFDPSDILLPLFPLWWKATQGKIKPIREEKSNIDFFFVFTQLLLAFSVLPLFTHHPPLSAAHRVHITSHNSRTPYCCSYEVSEGRGYSWRRIKFVKWSECVCFSESCTNWPVPDDKEPRRLSRHCRRPGVWVQEWFVQLSHLLIPLSVCFFNFLFKADWNWLICFLHVHIIKICSHIDT